MISRELTIVNKLGLHARAAAKFVSLASSFSSDIRVTKDGKTVNGKSIMGVMMLAASQNSQITVNVEGEDENLIENILKGIQGNVEVSAREDSAEKVCEVKTSNNILFTINMSTLRPKITMKVTATDGTIKELIYSQSKGWKL